jgi:hypothetical protein
VSRAAPFRLLIGLLLWALPAAASASLCGDLDAVAAEAPEGFRTLRNGAAHVSGHSARYKAKIRIGGAERCAVTVHGHVRRSAEYRCRSPAFPKAEAKRLHAGLAADFDLGAVGPEADEVSRRP